MKQKIRLFFREFRPPFFLSLVGTVLFTFVSFYLIYAQETIPAAAWIEITCEVLSALFLTMTVWSAVRLIRVRRPAERLERAAHRTRFTAKLWDDYSYRTLAFTSVSLVMNFLFAVSKGLAGWFFSSAWLIALSAYYLALCVMRFFLFRSGRKILREHNEQERNQRELHACRICGGMLMMLAFVLQGIVVMIVRYGHGFTYDGVLIYVVACYDFYCLINAIVYMVHNRKKHSPLIGAIKSVSFASSLVSMLSLQTAMFASFGGDADLQQFLNGLLGTAVCALLLILGIAMFFLSFPRGRRHR